MTETGSVIIESPVGADIIVDGVKVGTVGAPISETGKLSITTVPTGARVYTKRLGDYIYAGLSPRTLSLPASPVPVLVKVTKDEYSDVFNMVYLVPNETVQRVYAMERIAIEEPEETTTTLNATAHPNAELFLYMEGAEGFISYGRTPQTITLKSRTGAWVPMAEAKRALAEARLSAIESERVETEDARRVAIVDAAHEAYETAKAEREDVEATLSGFRGSYNLFQASFNVFFSGYSTFITDYSSLQSEIASLKIEIAQLEGMDSLDEWDEEYLKDCTSALSTLETQIAALQSTKDMLDAEKVQWDADRNYWTEILLDYEQRRQKCREYEEQMEHEWIEAKLRARSPFWLPTPGMKGVKWHLKLEEPGYRTEVDEFLLEPGVPMTKDYSIVQILDVTTPESLAPLIINTPRPKPPELPFAFAWLFIIPWPEGIPIHVYDSAARKYICKWGEKCALNFIKVKPGRRTYIISRSPHGSQLVKKTLDIAPGETRYIQVDIVPLTPAQREEIRLKQEAAGDWLSCGSGSSTPGRFEATKAAARVS